MMLAVGTLIVFSAASVMLIQQRRAEDESEKAVVSPAIRFQLACQELIDDPEKTTLHIRDFEVGDNMMESIDQLETIETLIFDRGIVTDGATEAIAALPRLRQLRLRLSPITDQGMETLATCATLQFLNLPHADCSSEGVAQLTKLPKLRQLRLGSKKLTNDVTKTIAQLTTLRTLHLIGVPVSDKGLRVLAELPQLESLYLDDSAVTDAGWEWLFKHRAQWHVHMDQNHHDRDPHRHEHR